MPLFLFSRVLLWLLLPRALYRGRSIHVEGGGGGGPDQLLFVYTVAVRSGFAPDYRQYAQVYV